MDEITFTCSSAYVQFLSRLASELGITIPELIQSAFEMGFDRIDEEREMLAALLKQDT